MKKNLVTLLLILIGPFAIAQEICDNGIDDDGDGFIDLNDDECECTGSSFFGLVPNLVPNPSFEDMSCCPDFTDDMECVDDWHKLGPLTSDYYNHCGYFTIGTGPEFPLPSPGAGYVGFWNEESVGTCLLEPLEAGVTYYFSAQFSLENYWIVDPDLSFMIIGGSECVDYIDENPSCSGNPYWDYIADDGATVGTDNSWTEVNFFFTPTEDYYSLAIQPCGSEGYFYMDDVLIADSADLELGSITATGNYCNGDLQLTGEFGAPGILQWYKDGVAIVGENTDVLDITGDMGPGEYSILLNADGQCYRLNYLLDIASDVNANFSVSDICHGDDFVIINESTVSEELTVEWEWDFGDDNTSDLIDPTHMYSEPGDYEITLIIDADFCSDTLVQEVSIFPTPEADLEFVIGFISSKDGATGGCIVNPVQFNDLSTITAPGTIISYNWDFGDDNTSIEVNPEHMYEDEGTYTVTLVVISEDGCTSNASIEIIMTNGLTLDILPNDPSCYGFNDGSVTVNVFGGGGEINFTIMDEEGNIRNEENSNVANNLKSGWYYIQSDDGSICAGVDSVFLEQPLELEADFTVFDTPCYGDSSGVVVVDTVYNAQGDLTNISYFWAPNYSGEQGVGVDSAYGMPIGDYTLTINDDNGCSRVYDFQIGQPDPFYFVELGFDPAYCREFNYQSGNGVVFAAAAGGTGDFTYQWTYLEDTTVNSNSSTWGGRNPGRYEIVVTDDNGCQITEVITVDSLNPIADFHVISDDLQINPFTLECGGTADVEVEFVNQSQNYINPNDPVAEPRFFWNLDHTGNGTWHITDDFDQRYDSLYQQRGDSYVIEVCLIAQNQNGCKDTLCKPIHIYEPIQFDPVNIFTPNSDGVNDIFTFDFRSKSIRELHCKILNRWGVIVSEFDGIESGWDGIDLNGDPCPDGVYFYRYDGVADDGTFVNGQGTVQLVRGD